MPRVHRFRELVVLAAGLAAALALAWAGATVHRGLATASEVAAARLSDTIVETVVREWQGFLRGSEPPVEAAGETFRFPLELDPPLALRELEPPAGPTAFETLLAESERRELVEGDPEGALELVLEALAGTPEAPRRAEAWLRALQLGLRLGRDDLVREHGARLRALELAQAREGIPYRLLAALALHPEPPERPDGTLVLPGDLARLFLAQDRLVLGPGAGARFELAPLLVVTCERLGLEPPSLEYRKAHALARTTGLPSIPDDGQWHLVELGGHPFVARGQGDGFRSGWFYDPRALERRLVERAELPPGFALDFAGTDEGLGVAMAPRTPLAGSSLAFTLRHEDPARLGSAEARRLRLLRAALLALALACAGGGFLLARLLARQRKLAELKSAFVAGVSHDLRTPLSSILLLAENLESGVAAADPARYHRALKREALRLRRLVDDVLDFSRLERGKAPELEREPVALAPFADELEADLGARVRERGRDFACRREALPAEAMLDAHALRRALENLIDNALKHGQGAVTLTLAGAAGRLRLAVADDGPGVPAAEQERIFEPFERHARDGHVGGAGLGLAIVRSIARAHGGEARVRPAAPGTGAVFELDLPLEDPA